MTITRFLHPDITYAIHSDTDTENSAVVISEGPCNIHSLDVDNSANGAASFVKFYDTLATVVVGTTVPDYIFMVPASVRVTFEAPLGLVFSAACQVATVTAAGTAGSTSPTSSAILKAVYTPEEE